MYESANGNSTGSYCSNGFPERDRLVSDVALRRGPAIRLIPEMNFTCNGTITGFTFAGSLENRQQESPMIQVWRENNSQPSEYYRTGANITIEEASCMGGFTEVLDRVFRCDLNEIVQVSVQPGDILGLELPSANNDAIALSFANVTKGPINYVFSVEKLPSSLTAALSESDSVNRHLPQITIKVSGVLSLCMV